MAYLPWFPVLLLHCCKLASQPLSMPVPVSTTHYLTYCACAAVATTLATVATIISLRIATPFAF